tara:strand:+ start:222 stop:524 length:303 start_codon:yes stop_codon:yes gene_type:complete
MNFSSSSKTEAEVGLKSRDKGESPLHPEDMSNRQRLKMKLSGFVRSVTSDSRSPVIREISGTISCMAVIAWVSGYTLGTWLHNTKKQLINKINDTINRPL